ncbi:unnamed protein product [Brugia pahangi]|uniref:DnaJ homolog subfamily B member 9 n=1 Tax=Brugia pahangi TaxID=6280 RepID=A0A0N4T685_BRUPA|nr:unnamed protein product [Brugia pahangi]
MLQRCEGRCEKLSYKEDIIFYLSILAHFTGIGDFNLSQIKYIESSFRDFSRLTENSTKRSDLPFVNERHRPSDMNYLLLFLVLSLYYIDGKISTEIEDPYQVLGVSRKATIKEIKHAYKALVKEWHPDKSEEPDSHEKFMAITHAYEILSDPVKRERYDKFDSFDDPPSNQAYTHYSSDDLVNDSLFFKDKY